jgi:hypothetical protein
MDGTMNVKKHMYSEQPIYVQLTNTDVESNVIAATLVAILWQNDQMEPDFKKPQIIPLALTLFLHPDLF